MRATQEQLKELKEKYGVDRLYSWSRLNLYNSDPYSYLLRYIKHIDGDRGDNSYSFFGTRIHDMLEGFYKGEYNNETMVEKFNDDILIQELAHIKFHSNEEMNNSIKENYITCIKHFLGEYEKDDNAMLEQFIYGKIGNGVIMGYVDKMHILDNILYIDDYKASTIYKGDKIENEKGQLYMYAILVNQMRGIPLSQMRLRWNFLKYVIVDYEQINGKIIQTTIKRNEIGTSLTAKITTWLKRKGYSEDDINIYLAEVKRLNEEEYKDKGCLSILPIDIQNKFNIHDAEVEVEINQKDIDNFIKNISSRIDQIEAKESLYLVTEDDKLFWSNVNDKNSFYYVNLCDYSSKYHLPLKEYFDNCEKMKESNINLTDDDYLKKLLFD